MCELKFRVFDDVNFGTPQIRHFNIYQAHFINRIEKLEIMKYTGLKDKNGKDIYEGDILKWDEKEWGSKFNEKVFWDYEQFSGRKNDWEQFCEVIGNIYENPELLEGVSCE